MVKNYEMIPLKENKVYTNRIQKTVSKTHRSILQKETFGFQFT